MSTQHSSIGHANCHEPKHITIATTADAGKVITPSSASNGVSVLRKLDIDEINGGFVPAYGSMAIVHNTVGLALTAAADTTLHTTSQYTPVTGFWSEHTTQGMTFSSGTMTVTEAGVYLITVYYCVSMADGTNNKIGFTGTLNGSPVTGGVLIVNLANAIDVHTLSASGITTLAAGDAVGVCMAVDDAQTYVIQDALYNIVRIA